MQKGAGAFCADSILCTHKLDGGRSGHIARGGRWCVSVELGNQTGPERGSELIPRLSSRPVARFRWLSGCCASVVKEYSPLGLRCPRGWLGLLLALAVGVGVGCDHGNQMHSTRTHRIYSEQLQKDMIISVLLPGDYSPSHRYPVLYFFPDYGGGPALVTQHVATDPMCLQLADTGRGVPLIIVGVGHDQSFMLETNAPTDRVTTASGKTFGVGRYESYFIEEVIPFVERTYSIVTEPWGRYVGGYSLGGYAALRLGLTRPDLFSRVGAHSPTLFLDSLPDASASAFLYPTEELRDQRDPLRLIEAVPEPPSNVYYLDTGLMDINRDACELMADRLRSRGVQCELHLNPDTHGRSYWMDHMADYLTFYAGSPPNG